MSEPNQDFSSRLVRLAQNEVATWSADDDARGAAIEAATRTLAFLIASACGGHAPTMSKMLDGTSQYLLVQAAYHARIIRAVHGTSGDQP